MARMKEWAIYKGDDFQFIGNTKECAEYLKIKVASFKYLTTPTYKKRVKGVDGIFVVDLGVAEEYAM